MIVGADEPCPRPTDPFLADAVTAASNAGQAAWIVDDQWRFVHVSDVARSLWTDKGGGHLGSAAIGHHMFSTESLRIAAGWRVGVNTIEQWRDVLRSLGGMVLADTVGGRDGLRRLVDPALHDLVDELAPCDVAAHAFELEVSTPLGPSRTILVATRIRDGQGGLRGSVLIGQPAMPAFVLGTMLGTLDPSHLDRMMSTLAAGRRPGAILMADIERSSSLSRRLSTAHYFTLARRLVRATDQCVIDAGGLIGRHLGDGVTAFFPAETSGSESAAARACISAARAMRTALRAVAERSDLDPDAFVARIGLHWGASLYVGSIASRGRFEVTGMGDDVNDAARIEACASGRRMLASKHLVERLSPEDAGELGVDPDRILYTQLADLDTATDKARRDAPVIAVCEL